MKMDYHRSGNLFLPEGVTAENTKAMLEKAKELAFKEAKIIDELLTGIFRLVLPKALIYLFKEYSIPANADLVNMLGIKIEHVMVSANQTVTNIYLRGAKAKGQPARVLIGQIDVTIDEHHRKKFTSKVNPRISDFRFTNVHPLIRRHYRSLRKENQIAALIYEAGFDIYKQKLIEAAIKEEPLPEPSVGVKTPVGAISAPNSTPVEEAK